MKRALPGLVLAFMTLLATMAWTADDKAAAQDRLTRAGDVLNQIMSAPDKGIPGDIYGKAKCVAVIPALKKAGFIVGGEHGRGVATCRTSSGWSAPAFFSVTGGSWGAQIGGAEADIVMLVMNDKGMQDLLSSKFQLGGDVTAAAGPVGRDAAANTDAKMNAEVLTYSRAKGAFAGITLNGAAIHEDQDAATAFYGQPETFRALLGGQVPAPPDAQPFLAAVAHNGAMSATAH